MRAPEKSRPVVRASPFRLKITAKGATSHRAHQGNARCFLALSVPGPCAGAASRPLPPPPPPAAGCDALSSIAIQWHRRQTTAQLEHGSSGDLEHFKLSSRRGCGLAGWEQGIYCQPATPLLATSRLEPGCPGKGGEHLTQAGNGVVTERFPFRERL